ncbi:hypothetical protein C8R45DRAFT_1099044 [Mycena sanguinolenta]|nr:hypothetical protein C8R45DRAFT_1099044 [Mycena sanguinolenta]
MTPVPFSVYNMLQEATYQPNDTLPSILLGNFIASVLKNSADSFTPQLLNVGETITPENYIFKYTIAQVFEVATSFGDPRILIHRREPAAPLTKFSHFCCIFSMRAVSTFPVIDFPVS